MTQLEFQKLIRSLEYLLDAEMILILEAYNVASEAVRKQMEDTFTAQKAKADTIDHDYKEKTDKAYEKFVNTLEDIAADSKKDLPASPSPSAKV